MGYLTTISGHSNLRNYQREITAPLAPCCKPCKQLLYVIFRISEKNHVGIFWWKLTVHQQRTYQLHLFIYLSIYLQLNGLYSSPNIVRVIKSRRIRWAGHVARMGEERGAYRVLVGKPEGKRPVGRPRRRWVDNIRMDVQEVGCGYVDWIGLAQDRDGWRKLVNAVMNLRVPWNAGNFLTGCKPASFSRRTLHHGVSKYGAR